MTITEANRVNTVLKELIASHQIHGDGVSANVHEAAAFLAHRANQALSAGLTRADIDRLLPVRSET